MQRATIAPSILSADFERLGEQIRIIEQAGIQSLHLDVMDGHFVPNISFGPPVIKSIRKKTSLVLDTHLMITDPDRYLEAFREAGSDIITVHQEACTHLHRTVARIHELGAKAGVAVNPATPLSTILEILPDIELLLVMSVNPGFGGQQYIKGSTEKIRRAHDLIVESGKQIILEVDGGIDLRTAPQAVEAGAGVLVAGTSLFGATDLRSAIHALTQSFSSNIPA
ncbi:MAG: ribulose-phosphate 3-epimerase [Bacteroidota bacterium]